MARIRTIKPEFFIHEGLFDLEQETGLPVRVAFAGLFTVADRKGRFEWRPRRLKAAVLPYDDIDFSRVLDALTTRGFLVRYASQGRTFGAIPSWDKHQVVNNREKCSEFPEPPQVIDEKEQMTRPPRVPHASPTPLGNGQAEGEGEQEGERDSEPIGSSAVSAPLDLKSQIFGPCLRWLAKHTSKTEAQVRPVIGRWCSRYGDGGTLDGLVAAARASPMDPIAWIESILNGKAKPKGWGQKFSTAELARILADEDRLQGANSEGDHSEAHHALPSPGPCGERETGGVVPERADRRPGGDGAGGNGAGGDLEGVSPDVHPADMADADRPVRPAAVTSHRPTDSS